MNMNYKDKLNHIKKYNLVLIDGEEASRFIQHIRYFLEHEEKDDEEIAQVLDFMYENVSKN